MSVVLLERPAEGVALVRINRPEARNALNMDVRRGIAEYFTALSAEEDVRCIVLTGNKEAFAAGADIKQMADVGAVDMMLRATHRYWKAVADCPKPIIASVNGFALGGGCELAMNADIIVAGEGEIGRASCRERVCPYV